MGEPAINALDDAGVDAQIAADLIDETTRNMQLKGWWWNREKHTLSPDSTSGAINLPNNTAKVDSIDGSANIDVVSRGLRLFNRSDNSYAFTNPVTVDLIIILPFDDLPLAAKAYVAYSSAMILQRRLLGSETLDKFLEEGAKTSWAELVRDDIQVSDPNILRDNWSTLGIVQRGFFRRGAYI